MPKGIFENLPQYRLFSFETEHKMKKYTYIVTAAAAVLSTPSYASNEGYVETRFGYSDFELNETIGLAVGYDFDINDNLFLGSEIVVTTNPSFESPVYAANARFGVKAGDADKVFGTVGYAYHSYFEIDDTVLGAGYEHKFGNTPISIQYQRSLTWDISHVFVGVGIKF